MKPAALLLWLTLFGGESQSLPSTFVGDQPSVPAVSSAWVGAWLVGQTLEPMSARFVPVAGREQLAGQLRFGDGPRAVVEQWVGRLEGGRLRLSRAGTGEARLSATGDGRLVGRLSRLKIAGDVELRRQRE